MTKPNANEETEIRALIDDWARAIRAKDATAVVSQYAADNVKFILAPPQPKVEFELVLCSMLLRL